ncbi:MAG: glycosyltransferase family 4 protein [Polaromonas sp.]|uniref:glycosyltransferase family 4 protein n=1 Tax=Polaromonas sp. TaxID=1869339 RepID=UPI0027321241|nr:glycosyltransferase family 4 protein [Polaromonas sp.]MDP2450422.1 glycosyltransferase family 4 protein [Polaromonas sp.]MDP3247158.1 glycosyltransferase family 4 protein [Polaromonas sp.]MDP3757054.1 glycosyltransferase family 4 protein [Polaromonas sp.]
MQSPFPPANLSALSGIRIARISTVPFFVVTQLKHQIAMLGQSGALVTVVTSAGAGMEVLRDMGGVRCEIIDIRRAISPGRDVLALMRLFLFFRKNRTQIAHSTTPKAGLLTAIAAFLAGVPVRLHTFTGQPWVGMGGVKGRLARLSDMLVGRLNTRCYADSASQRQFLIDQQILGAGRLAVIGAGSLAGVDMQRFDRARFSPADRASLKRSLGIPEIACVLLFVGRITQEKGVRELLRAFGALKPVFPEAHLVLVGPADEESGVDGSLSHEDLTRLDDVHGVGYTDCPESYMAIADVLCLPSYREGFGTVVIEAAAMGVPTVGSAIYGLTDAVVHEETGLLVPPKNSGALATALHRMLESKSLRTGMGEAARRRAQALFDAETVNLQLAQEYGALLRSKNMVDTCLS